MSVEVKNLPNLLVFSHFTYEKYEGKVTHQGNTCYVLTGRIRLTVSERFVCAIKALAATILTFGVGLLFSRVQEFWKHALYGTKQVKAYGTIDQIPDSIKAVVLNNGNVNVDNPKPTNNDPKSTKPQVKLTKEEAFELITEGAIEFEKMPPHLQHDPIFLLQVIKQSDRIKQAISGISSVTREDLLGQLLALPSSHPLFNKEDFLLDLIKRCHLFIQKSPIHFLNNKEFLLKAIEASPQVIQVIPLPDSHIKDKELITKWIAPTSYLVSGRFDTFNRMAEDLRNDITFVDQLKQSNFSLDEFLRCQSLGFNDDEVVLSLIKQDATIFHLLPESKQSDFSFIIRAIKANINTFYHIPTKFKHDKASVLEFIERFDLGLMEDFLNLPKFLSVLFLTRNPLCTDPEFIEKIIRKTSTIQKVPVQLLNNRNFLLKILDIPSLNKEEYQYLPKKFANDKEIILKWISIDLRAEDMARISPTLKKNSEFVKKAKACCPDFEYVLEEDGNRNLNKNQALELVKDNARNFTSLNPNLQYNQEFLIECLKANWEVSQYIDVQLCIGDGEIDEAFILKIVEQVGKLPPRLNLYSIKTLFQNQENVIKLIKLIQDPEEFLKFIKSDGYLADFEIFKRIDCLSERIANDREIIAELVRKDPTFIRFASGKLREETVFKAF